MLPFLPQVLFQIYIWQKNINKYIYKYNENNKYTFYDIYSFSVSCDFIINCTSFYKQNKKHKKVKEEQFKW